jgi:hypothetical protein
MRSNHLWAILLSGAAVLVHGPAQACGGFFCNRPVNTDQLPVAQTGENVLFAMDPKGDGLQRLEAHIQIFYTGPADRFSWVVPVDGVPQFDVGSNRIFQILDAQTRPSFAVQLHEEGVCRDDPGFTVGAGGTASPGSNSPPAGSPGTPGVSGVIIVDQGSAGPFDYVTVRSDDPQMLVAWLQDNKYYLSPEAEKLIRDYASEGKYFVAVKLQPGKGVTEIQPIVLRFDGVGPCVPLRLTAVASVSDLRVNLWVLSRTRVVPQNYYEITVNEAKIDWLGGGGNYEKLLKEAANEAGGNAFTVEYAGPPVSLQGLLYRSDLSGLRAATSAPDALDQLRQLGLNNDPGILELLRMFIPEPQALKDQGIGEVQYYNGLRGYWRTGDPFDGPGLADAVQNKIIGPIQNLQKLFAGHDKLTRLVTFISPEEMTVDPLFVENSTLPDVSNSHQRQAYRECGARTFKRCEAPIRLMLSDGRALWFEAPPGGGWCASNGYDRSVVDRMPSLEQGWMRAVAGEGAVKFDNRAPIADLIEQQNAGVHSGCGCDMGGRSRALGWWPLGLVLGLACTRARRRR